MVPQRLACAYYPVKYYIFQSENKASKVIIFLSYCVYLLLILAAFIGLYIYIYWAPDKSVEALSQRWAAAPSQFINIAGMNIHLKDEGPKTDKRAIVLIHGTSDSLHTWDGWVGALKEQRRVIRFDLPGFGLTGPDAQNNYTVEHYAEVVIAVLDELGIDKAVLGGNSLGASVSWASAVLYPDRVSGLVLVNSSGYIFKPKSVPIGFKLSQHPLTSELLKNVLPKSLVAKSIKNLYGNPDLVSDELVDRYYDLIRREGNRGALKERFKQSVSGFLVDKINTINVPTLIIWGGQDRLIPVESGKRFNQEIANSELVIFDDLGHLPHQEDPQATVLIVKRFLNGSHIN
jgi:pimeloyl-ACP methyl ester carboxylesterase